MPCCARVDTFTRSVTTIIAPIGSELWPRHRERHQLPYPLVLPFAHLPYLRPSWRGGNKVEKGRVSKQEPICGHRREREVEVVTIVRAQHQRAMVDRHQHRKIDTTDPIQAGLLGQ